MRQFAAKQFSRRQFPVWQYKDAVAQPVPPTPVVPPQFGGGGGGMPSSWLRLEKDRQELQAKEALRRRIIQEDEEFFPILVALARMRLH